VGGGCGHGIDPQGREREGGFFNRASWNLLGEFGFGSEDTIETDSGGEEIRGGNLFLSSSIRCPSGVRELDWAIAGVGFGEVEKEAIR
jgi:hypothetical protein